MSEFIPILLSAATSSGLMSLIVFLIQRRDRSKEKETCVIEAQNEMLIGLAHDRILHLTDEYVERGSITLEEKRNLDYLYAPYRKLGGNGDCRIGYEECQKLSIAKER